MIKVITRKNRQALNNMKDNVLCNIYQRLLYFMNFLLVTLPQKKLKNLKRYYAYFMKHKALWKKSKQLVLRHWTIKNTRSLVTCWNTFGHSYMITQKNEPYGRNYPFHE